MKQQQEKDKKTIEVYRALRGVHAVAARLSGKRPLLALDGKLFEVDVECCRMWPMGHDQPGVPGVPGIEFEKGAFRSEDEQYRFIYYDRRRMEDMDPELISEKDKVLLVRIPAPVALDPVMTAKRNGWGAQAYLHRYPMVLYREAEAIALNPALIRVLARRPALRDKPEKLFNMSPQERRALTAMGKRKRL